MTTGMDDDKGTDDGWWDNDWGWLTMGRDDLLGQVDT